MKIYHRAFSLACFAVAFHFSGAVAQAQVQGTAQIGNATVSVGGGTALLTLPDMASPMTRTTNTGPFTVMDRYNFSNDFGSALGWNVNGSVSMPFTDGNGRPMALSLNGFWSRITDRDSMSCTGDTGPQINCLVTPLVDDPAVQQIGGTLGAQTVTGTASRDVDHWGASAEARWYMTSAAPETPSQAGYFSAGADARGIFQNIGSTLDASTGATISYRDSLDTTYYGAFVALGTDFAPPIVGDLWQRWGLESSLRVQGGLYYAKTDYAGTLSHTAPFPGGGGDPSGSLSLSRSDSAFIGGFSMETRKRIGPRAILSLKSDLEYYSYVPKMKLNEVDEGPVSITDPARQSGTVIDSAGAVSLRTMLRLTIPFGD